MLNVQATLEYYHTQFDGIGYRHSSCRLIAAKQIPAACLSFAHEKKEELIEKGIVQNFMTHLIALCDIGLINPTVLKDSMTAVYTTSTTS